jgi:hypothetical protein
MKKLVLAAALIGFSMSTAFGQSGANPSAPQPGSTGVGVNQPGTTATGTAVDTPTKVVPKKKMKKSKK